MTLLHAHVFAGVNDFAGVNGLLAFYLPRAGDNTWLSGQSTACRGREREKARADCENGKDGVDCHCWKAAGGITLLRQRSHSWALTTGAHP